MNGDQITLTGLRVRGNHGVFAHERRGGQEFGVDITVHRDLAPAGASDALADTVDYGKLAELAASVVAGPACDLIETVACHIAERVLAENPLVTATEVTVHKPSAPIPLTFSDVAVTVRRAR